MAQDELRRAIELMQDGRAKVAAGMLRRLVDDPALDAKGRAAAFVWLAEASDQRDYKQRCLERALACDPENGQIRQGLNQLRDQPEQPAHLPQMGAPSRQAIKLEKAPVAARIDGGRNGPASGVFIGADGLVATTSYAVGSATGVTLRLDGETELSAQVARRYPAYDLAFITTPVVLARKPTVAPMATIAENAAFAALGFAGARLRGALLSVAQGADNHWLPTNISPAQLPDAGGNPLLDARGQLLGMLTRNLSPLGFACALKFSQIMTLAEQFRRDRQLMPAAGYCHACGGLARALIFGGESCETCGARLSDAGGRQAQHDQLQRLYGDIAAAPCAYCNARAGSYGGRCLRCGRATTSRSAS